MTPLDQYIHSQVGPLLQPGEHILHTSTMRRQPGLLLQILLVGGLLLMLITKTYLVALTNRRLLLVLTKASFWSGTPKPMNLGVEQYDVRAIKDVSTSGFANNRSMTFDLGNTKLKLRISPWFKSVSGTKDFFEQVPTLIRSGQLAAGHDVAPQQLGAGARVMVLAQDGYRYPGTVVHQQGEHCLCAMQNGQFWFPVGNVSPA